MSKIEYRNISEAQINKAAALIAKQGTKLQDLIHTMGLAAMYQVQAHRNVTPLNTLYKAIPAGMRRTAFALWAVQAGGVMINTNKNSKEASPLALDKQSEVILEIAEAKPWYKVKTEKDLDEVAFDIEAAMRKLFKQIEKNTKGVTDKALYERLQKAMVPPTVSADVDAAAAVPAAVLPNMGVTLPALPAQMH